MESQVTLSALKFISGEDVHVCRLCFASTEDGEYSLNGCVRLEKLSLNETLSFADMFSRLGVAESPEPSELPGVICLNCATSAINSYLFQRLCYNSSDRWREIISKLEECLSDTDFRIESNKCVYFFVSENNKMTVTCMTKIKKNKTVILDEVKKITSGRACNDVEDGIDFNSSKQQEKLRIPCPKCSKYFASQWKVEEHVKRIHCPKTLQCSRCGQMFSTEKFLRRHEKISHVSVSCILCSLQFPSQIALRNHLDKHEMNSCSNCSKNFSNKQSFRTHLKICGSTTPKTTFYCDTCGKGYTRKDSLLAHLKTAHGFGSFHSCNWCGKKFAVMGKLRSHIVKHTRERNFFCEHCGSKFVTKAALVYHTRLHTGEKPFPCDICDERFLSASRRLIHKRRKHFGPSKECSMCSAKFVTSSDLRKHQSRHFNPRNKLPYARTGTGN